MSTQHPTHTQTRTRRRARRGQSMVEYALTLALLVLVVQGTVRVLFNVVGTSLVSVRNRINTADDLTATPGPSPTIHLPPQPATLTSLPATATVIQMCTVPNLSNLQYVAAVAEWLNYGFSPGTLAQPSGKPNNMIVGSQSLVAGGSQKPCATTTMTVYAKQCTVPNLVGQIFTVARDGDWVGNEFFAENLSAPNNADLTLPIGSQQYAVNSKIDCDQTMSVTLVPPTPTLCTVPNMAGNSISQANTLWTTARFTGALNNPLNITGSSIKVATQEQVAGTLQPCSISMWVRPLTCVVPDLSGDLYSVAIANGGSFKGVCSAATLSKAWGNNNPADRVIGSTGPVAGTEIINDSTVTVTANEMQCTVPNMSGQLYSAATAAGGAWRSAQFSSTLSKAWGVTAPADRVIGTTSPAAGSSVACSSGTVTANEGQCTVPNLQNMTFTAAGAKWTQDGFSSVLGRTNPPAPATGEFTVGTQTLTANSPVICSSAMTVGPKMCLVPNLLTMTFTDASAKWTQDGFTSALGRDLTTAPGTGEFIVSTQSRTASATSIDCTSTMTVGQKMCTVPSMSGKNIGTANTAWTTNGFTGALLNPLNVTGTTVTIATQQYPTSPQILCSTSMWVKPLTCIVPDLSGDLYTVATANGGSFKSVCSAATLAKAWSTTLPADRVIGSTGPVAGTEIINHSSFTVTANELMCTVPDMSGELYSNATATGGTWKGALFTATLGKAWGVTAPADRVIGTTTPAAGSLVACSSGTVTANEKLCTVPNLQNMTFTNASAKWNLDGFTSVLGRDTPAAPATGEFTVNTQTQTANSSLTCSSTMLVGPKMCTVPPMSGKTFAEANTAWTGAGFTGLLQNPLNLTGTTIKLASQQYTTSPQQACTTSMWVKPLTCTVPDLNNDLYSAAVATGGTFKSVCSNAILQKPAAWGTNDGRIGSTNPVFGTEIIDHSSVTVTVNEMMCTVPSLSGKTLAQATPLWTNAGFTGALEDPWSIVGTTATVLSQEYGTNSQQLCSTPMWVKPATCVVPDLSDKLFNDVTGTGAPFKVACSATTLIRGWGPTTSLNLRIGTTSPVVGTEVVNHNNAKFAVTANEMMCTVPNLNGFTYTNATATGGPWLNAKFTSTLTKGTGVSNSTVIVSTNPAAGNSVLCSAAVIANK